MEALALSIDERNADDWKRLPAASTPEVGEEQPTSGQNHGDPGPAGLSLEDTIRKYIPDDSPLALSLKKRKSSYWFVRDHGFTWPPSQYLDFESIDFYRTASKNRGLTGMLVVYDINLDWCKALCARYKATLHPELLAGRIIRFDEVSSALGDAQAIEQDFTIRYSDAKIEVHSSGNFMAVQMIALGDPLTLTAEESALRLRLTFKASGGKAHEHLSNLDFGAARLDNLPLRQDKFVKDEFNRWRRISACITCFRLEADFYLMLLDPPPVATRNSDEGYHPGIFRIDDYPTMFSETQKMLPRSADPGHDLMDSIAALFRRHTMQSIFNPRSRPRWPEFESRQSRMNADIFSWLLIESSWRLSVTHLESESQQIRWEATTMAGDEAFTRLTSLRRRLADAYGILAEVRQAFDDRLAARYIFWDIEGKDLSADDFWSEERGQRGKSVALKRHEAQSIDIRDLPTLLEELPGRITTMTQTVNEEIQMVIGSVQFEDARVMRRQTEWTVVLAVLAAIYLPMTLVTGIFGMNITEIGAEATVPDRCSVVKACGIVFGATMGSVLVYAVARYVLRYRRVGRMLLRRRMRKIGDGWLYRRVFAFKARLQRLWLYQKIHGFGEKMREWDVEAQKMENME